MASAARSNEFIAYLHEVFAGFGPVTARRMFGGHGIYHDGLMFALVAGDTLYLKADAVNAPEFTRRGLAAFTYTRQGKPARLGYYQAPAEILDDPDQAVAWARRSFEAALRARTARKTSS